MKATWSVWLLLGLLAVIFLVRYWEDRALADTVSMNDSIRMELHALEPAVRSMEEAGFHLRITDRSGAPVRNAQLSMHITMPDMFCGELPATVIETEPGLYRAAAVPVMSGRWQAEAMLAGQGKTLKVKAGFTVQ